VDGEAARRLAADTTLGAVAAFDLVVALLIAAAVVLLGQAIVSYEIFTGKSLPRGGLRRHWRSAIILAAGYSAVVAGSLIRGWQPISGILLATLFMTAFYALFSWRSYAERERYMGQLRPFVASQGLYADLLAPAASPAVDAAGPFRALCADVLGARVAHLAAVGPLAPLVGAPLAYPPDAAAPLPVLAEIAGACHSPQTLCVGVDPAAAGGARWAVPLWSERGLIGALLLGEKRDGGLYTQEEIEIARASGERLIDTQASAALAGRLMALQRQRLAESRVLDRQARRALHDDVLPLLHTAMLSLGESGSAEGLALLADAHRRISDLLREMPSGAAPAVARLGLVTALRQALDDEWAGAFDSVTWDVAPTGAAAAAALPPLAAEVLFYAAREAIRNAARYGRPADGGRPLRLRIAVTAGSGLEITIEDDGVGLATAPGAPAGGAGQGLALHSTLLAVVGGTLAVESAPDRYTRVALALPATALVAA
jgi:signal transduction histidine kinase